MQLKSAFVLLAATGTLFPTAYSAAIGSKSVVNATDVALAARDVGNVYVCTDANWEGDCTNLSFAGGYCENLAPEFEYDVTSIGPDPYWACWFYAAFDCQAEENGATVIHYEYQYPGIADLTMTGENSNDVYLSFVCYGPYTGSE